MISPGQRKPPIFALDARSRYEQQKLRVVMGLIHYHLKDYDRADKVLTEASIYFDSISSHYAMAEIRFVEALLKEDQGKSHEAASQWDRNQPRELLKAVVSHGGQKVSKDLLMDDLWPDEEPASAEKSFKTALQRLRKSLEPDIDPEFGFSYIHLHDAFVSLDSNLVQLDIDLFLSLLWRGEEREKGGDSKAALSLYTEAMGIYKGDFLPEDSYALWADIKRGELRRKYVDLLHHMAMLQETQDALKKAITFHRKAIEADPLLEESYQRLMVLYSTKGMQNEALRVYDDCKKALKRGLKARPDPVTTALYNKILEKLQTP